jgi:membrane protease YdiL (CAAX protease family)
MNFHLNAITIVFLVWVLWLMPGFAWAGYCKLQRGEAIPPKLLRFRMGFYQLLFSCLIAIPVAISNDLPLSFTAEPLPFVYGLLLIGVLLTGVIKKLAKQDPSKNARVRLLYAPTNFKELRWAILIAICAGISEEIVYRGVLFELLTRLTSSRELAVLLSVMAFALAHLPQGGAGTFAVGCLGLLFQTFYFLSGGLTSPIVIHAVYDVVIFAALYRYETRWMDRLEEGQAESQLAPLP